jgi:phage-related protein
VVSDLIVSAEAELAKIYKDLYISWVPSPKPLRFIGSSLDDLRDFPASARREAGHQLDQIQNGEDPDDWKPMTDVGPGVQEIRITDRAGAFRVLYVARLQEAVFVLHCFQKKTQKTARTDIDLAARRFRELMREH